jgi:hypothetical protein
LATCRSSMSCGHLCQSSNSCKKSGWRRSKREGQS